MCMLHKIPAMLHRSFGWNWSANLFASVELECQLFGENGTGVPCSTRQPTTINWSWLCLFCRWNWSAELECQANVAVQFLYEYKWFLIWCGVRSCRVPLLFLCVSWRPRKAKITIRKYWQIQIGAQRRHCAAAPRPGWPGFSTRSHTYPIPHWYVCVSACEKHRQTHGCFAKPCVWLCKRTQYAYMRICIYACIHVAILIACRSKARCHCEEQLQLHPHVNDNLIRAERHKLLSLWGQHPTLSQRVHTNCYFHWKFTMESRFKKQWIRFTWNRGRTGQSVPYFRKSSTLRERKILQAMLNMWLMHMVYELSSDSCMHVDVHLGLLLPYVLSVGSID